MMPGPRPIPTDFATVAPLLRDKESCHRWNVGQSTLTGWKRRMGLTRPYRCPLPSREQLQHLTDTMTQTAAAKRLGVSRPTFRKMQIEAGVLA